MNILFLFSVIFILIAGAETNNDTHVEPTETTVATDPRCLSGCTFESSLVDSATLKYFPKNCTTVCTPSALYIGYETDLTEKQLTDTFKNMKHLIGDLIVTRSKYKSGRFMASLETVDCYNYGFFKWTLNGNMTEIGLPHVTSVSCRVEIKGNSNLTMLNLPNLIPIASPSVNYSTIDVEISSNAENFCITVQEVSNLMTHDYIKFDELSGSYCDAFDNSTSLPEKKICDLTNYLWSELHSGCVFVHGDVIIDGDNQEHAPKLESVETIFGSLFIYNTNLTSIDFLGNLEHIVSLSDDHPALIVELNEELVNVSFPKLERILSRVYVSVIFANNSDTVMKNPSNCYDIRNSVTSTDTWIVKFDGKTCEDVEKAVVVVKDKSSRSDFSMAVLVISIFIGITFLK